MRISISKWIREWGTDIKGLSVNEGLILLFLMLPFVLSLRLYENVTLYIKGGNIGDLIAESYYVVCRIFYALTVPIVYIIYKKNIKRLTQRCNYFCVLLSVWMSLTCTIGYSFSEVGSWDLCFNSFGNLAIWIWQSVAFLFYFYFCLSVVYFWIDKEQQTEQIGSTIDKKRTFFFLFILSLPYWMLLWPGEFQWDSYFLVNEYLDGKFDNHNPIIYQFFFGELMKLGIKYGCPEILFSILSLIQIGLFCGLVTISAFILCKHIDLGWNKVKWALFFYALNPIFAISSVQIIKDFYFSLVLFAYIILLFCHVRVNHGLWKRNSTCFFHFILLILLCLTKNQGVYIVIVMMGVLIFYNRKQWLRITCLYIPVILFYQVFLLGYIFPKYEVDQSTRKQESLGWMFQATARYVRDFPQDVYANEIIAISKVLVYDSLATRYELECSDGIKGSASRLGLFNRQCTDEELANYFKTWLTMGIRHPIAYIQSTIGTSYINLYYMQSYPEQYTPQPEWGPVIKQNPLRVISNTMVAHVFNRIPIIGKLVNTPTYIWIFIILMGYFLYRKRWSDLIWTAPITLSALILLISPCGGFRYSEPIIWTVPFILMTTLSKNRELNN